MSAEDGEELDLIRVALVDDHPVACFGMAQMLAGDGDLVVVAAAHSLVDLRRRLAAAAPDATPDVLVMDLYLDGEEPSVAEVGDIARAIPVLVMSASARPADVLGAIKAGARGYVTKHASRDLFTGAVKTVAAGGFSLSSELADIIHSATSARPPGQTPSSPTLSRREEQTLSLIARGLTHAQAASRMGLSKATVDTYVERIRTKLQVGNKAELTRAALTRSTEGDGR